MFSVIVQKTYRSLPFYFFVLFVSFTDVFLRRSIRLLSRHTLAADTVFLLQIAYDAGKSEIHRKV